MCFNVNIVHSLRTPCKEWSHARVFSSIRLYIRWLNWWRMMWRVMVNVTFSTNGSKICSFFIKSILGPREIWKQSQNLITSWCRITKKNSRGMSHFQPIRAKLSWNVDIFDQWKLDFTPMVVASFFESPRWLFHF